MADVSPTWLQVAAREDKLLKAERRSCRGAPKLFFTRTERLLVDFINQTGGSLRCSKRVLARACGSSVKTVSAAVRDLKNRGVLEVSYSYNEDGAQAGNLYRLLPVPEEGGANSGEVGGHEGNIS